MRLAATAALTVICAWQFTCSNALCDEKGKTSPTPANRMTAYVTYGATEKEAIVTLWMSNVNPVGGICLPFKFAAADSFWLDSLVTKPFRGGSFEMMQPKYEKDKQTLLVNMLRASDSVKAKTGLIPAGEGILATIHFSSASKFPIDDFKIAAVQLPPENVLLYVTDTFNSVLPEFVTLRQAPPVAAHPTKTEKTP